MDFIFHFGLYKTASSLMQRKIFERRKYSRQISQCIRYSPKQWKQLDKTKLTEVFKDIYNSTQYKHYIHSNEQIYSARIFLYQFLKRCQREPFRIATSIGNFAEYGWYYGKVKCLIFTRRQPEWMCSMYAQLSDRIDNPGQEDFEQRVENLIREPDIYAAQCIMYDVLYSSLMNQNIDTLILPYESVFEKETWDRVADFTAINEVKNSQNLFFKNFKSDNQQGVVNQRRNGRYKWRLRYENREIQLTHEIEKKIWKFYHKSNQQLGQLTNSKKLLQTYEYF